MARPKKNRKIKCTPASYYFKPRGIPMADLQEVILEVDELEAIRLGDMLNFSHEKAALKMKISRATFGRIINKSRQKIADGMINGKAIRISKDLPVQLKSKLDYTCKSCGYKRKLRSKSQIKYYPKCK
jgi:predicted DNA-binding protein (UPF0251 family)